MKNLARYLAAMVVACSVFGYSPSTRAQAMPQIDRRITYILPQWFEYLSASEAEVAAQAAELRTRIGEGLRVKVGFTTYISVTMDPVDPADANAVRAALASEIADMEQAAAKAKSAGIALCLSFINPQRAEVDAAQAAAQAADRRTAQWYTDNSMATGWMTLSRYSRKDVALREAFTREIGRNLARLMLQYPETVVAASGDGEIELSLDGQVITNGILDPVASRLADYSPFAIAEFRDWLRQGGLYAPGQPFAGQSWQNSARYAGDSSPASDSNRDGHTLQSDFGVEFSTWDLKHFDWPLTDDPLSDPNAIASSVYDAPEFNPRPAASPGGFDAPRVRNMSDAYWQLWDLFRQAMVYRNNIEYARWITTSPDPATGATIPADRWFSDQVAADYLFTNVMVLPGGGKNGFSQPPTFRLDTSASPLWTANISPYGSLGVTAFNVNVGNVPGQGDVYYRTLAAVAPEIAARGVRWGIFEWNPSVPATATALVYEHELELVEKYRPSLLVPFAWDHGYRVRDTGFETALRNFVTRRNNVPLALNRSTLYTHTTVDGSARTPPQAVRVLGEPGETPTWTATSPSPFIKIVPAVDGRSFTVALEPVAYTPGVQSASVVVTPTPGLGYTSVTLTVNVIASHAGTTHPPTGFVDTPSDLQVVTGEVGITGWAIDDVGIRSIDIYRSPLPREPTAANGLVPIGTASQVEGARPDVQALYPTIPVGDRAGWGYMLLSNFLPNGGTGIYTIHAIATDMEGKPVSLGSRRVDARNGSATTPFGTIDTPAQGETISGTAYVNFGWALTRNPSCIPIDGSTIDVIIDGVVVGHPVYNNPRPDISGLFPGLCNTDGAVGYFYLDTTRLANGVHSISWVARDTGGGATGMGSRYFIVANP